MSEASWEEAESLLAAAARLQPELPDHHFQLGVLYLATDRPELALAAYERVLLCEAVYPADFDLFADAERVVERLSSELEIGATRDGQHVRSEQAQSQLVGDEHLDSASELGDEAASRARMSSRSRAFARASGL